MQFDPMKLKRDFERASVTYDDVAGLQRIVLHKLAARWEALFKPDGLILDAGCGTGALLSWLAANRHAPEVVPLDLAFTMCAQAASRQARRLAVNANIESLCFKGNSFDAIVSSLALQWVNDLPAAMREFRRILKPGGTLLISSFGKRTLHELKTAFSLTDAYIHISPFRSLEEHAQAARGAGLTVITGETQLHRQQVTSLDPLLRQLRQLGAGNKWRQRRKGLMTRGQLEAVERHYAERFGENGSLPVSWEIVYLACRN
jgi:malonyl-CoA O-methyltransferase